MANWCAKDGYRYGLMWTDGSVTSKWNGRTQRERALEYKAKLEAEYRVQEGSMVTLVRRRYGSPWKRVFPQFSSLEKIEKYLAGPGGSSTPDGPSHPGSAS